MLDTNPTDDQATPQVEDSSTELLDQLLITCIETKASDLHLSTGLPPYLRSQGLVRPLKNFATITDLAMQLLVERLSKTFSVQRLDETGSLDGALSTDDGHRFRYNIFRRGGEYSIALRRLENRIRTLRELGLPDSLYDFSELTDGLVLISGPTGSGKSTTLATLIDRINQTRQSHIITIEDPIEYLHPSKTSLVNQRQIGTDASTFNDALVASLRQDPDVIQVGEIRDLETIRTAITAAETGHLVFSTVHSGDCVGSIDRLVAVFPPDEQAGIRRQLSTVLRGVVAQRLLVADGGQGRTNGRDVAANDEKRARPSRVLASEMLIVNSGVAKLIVQARHKQVLLMVTVFQ